MVEPLVPLLRCNGKIVGEYIKSQGLKSVQRLNGDPRNGVPASWIVRTMDYGGVRKQQCLPGLIGKRMIIQPLIRKHTPEKDKTEWSVGFSGLGGDRILPFRETEEF